MDDFVQFMHGFYQLTGINLALYKRPQMERRLTTLRNKHGYDSFDAYMGGLRREDQLRAELLERMTINVSEFFRNPERWQALLPHLETLNVSHLAIWSAACSTGEEPYTIAMLMAENIRRPYHIYATDIDAKVLEQAQNGVYHTHQVKHIPDSFLQRYFDIVDNQFTVKATLRTNVQFATHNLLVDEYPNAVDLIICRNVLIYFTDEAKQFVVSSFARSLKPGGLLFVGSTEQFLRSGAIHLENVAPFLYRRKE